MLIAKNFQTVSTHDAANRFLLQFTESTRSAYSSDLRSWFSFANEHGFDPMDASSDHLNLFMRHSEEILGLSRPYVSRQMAAINGFYKKARVDGLISENPAENVRRPAFSDESVAQGIDFAEFSALLHVAEADCSRSAALVALLGLTGLRISEALGADVEDLGFERDVHTLSIVGKGNKSATVALPAPVWDWLQSYIGERTFGPLFLSEGGMRWHRKNAWEKIQRLGIAAKIGRPIHPHDLRHFFVTGCLDAGIPLHEVQDAARHASPVTTQRYNTHRNRLDNAPSLRLAAKMEAIF